MTIIKKIGAGLAVIAIIGLVLWYISIVRSTLKQEKKRKKQRTKECRIYQSL